MATAGASRVVISCIMPTSGSSGRPPTDVTPVPSVARMASAAVPCSDPAVSRLAGARRLVGSQAENANLVVSPTGVKRRPKLSLLGNSDTPGKLADLDRLDDLEICDVDDGDVVRYAVGREKIFFVRGKRHVPDALAHEKIFLDLVRRSIDHGNAISRTERYESCLAVPGDADPDRLNGLLAQSRNIEGDLLLHLVLRGVDDTHGATDFG